MLYWVDKDSTERLQLWIYLIYILLFNTIDNNDINVLLFVVSTEFFIDWIKNFFLIHRYNLDPKIILGHRQLLSRLYLELKLNSKNEHSVNHNNRDLFENEIKTDTQHPSYTYQSLVNTKSTKELIHDFSMMSRCTNEYYSVSMFQGVMVIPQVCLILKCIVEFVLSKEFGINEMTLFLLSIMIFGCTIKYIFKY